MRFGKILTLVATIFVIVLLTTSAIIPIVQSTSQTFAEKLNNPESLYAVTSSSEDVELYLNSSTGLIRINGEDDTQLPNTSPTANADKIWMENAYFRCRYNESTSNWSWQGQVLTEPDQVVTEYVRSISYSDGVATCTRISGGGTFTIETSFIMYPDSKGTLSEYYVSGDKIDNIHVDSDATIYLGLSALHYGLISVAPDGTQTQIGYSGDLDYDKIEAVYDREFFDSGLNWMFTSNPVMYRSVEGSDTISEPLTYVLAYIPTEYDGFTSSSIGIPMILNLIPMLLFVLPILVVVRFISGRND